MAGGKRGPGGGKPLEGGSLQEGHQAAVRGKEKEEGGEGGGRVRVSIPEEGLCLWI